MKSVALSLLAAALAAPPSVKVEQGELVGTEENGLSIFRGVPFAAPPMEDLRWRPPRPALPWQGRREAQELRSECTQTGSAGSLIGGEDCLYLNVYAPSLVTTSNANSLPVLLWVHGGGYETGSANEMDSSAANLVSFYVRSGTPAVVVTTNYRLNIFGFLASDALRDRDAAGGSTGNYGIQDQRAAFRWVRDNVGAFGGDSQRVMIFGESAGAASMTIHMVAPRSAGHFTRIAAESSIMSPYCARPMEHGEGVYQEVLTETKCADAACLLEKSSAELEAAVQAIPSGTCCNQILAGLFIPWAATVDGVELEEHPWDLLRKGNFNKVPVLHGNNMDEGSIFTTVGLTDGKSKFQEDFLEWFAVMGRDNASTVAELYYQEAQDRAGSSPLHVPALGWKAAELSLGDKTFNCPSHFGSAQLYSQGVPSFQYYFTPSVPILGSCHGSEIDYVFASEMDKDENTALAHSMATYWYRHAAFGDPNGANDIGAVELPHWPQYGDAGEYLQLSVESEGGVRGVGISSRQRQMCDFMRRYTDKILPHATSLTLV